MVGKRIQAALFVVLALAAIASLASCGGDGDDDSGGSGDEPTVVTGAGDIQAKVDEFRGLLGPDNGGAPDGDPDGRREINWDAVPDEVAAPNALPPDFFNGTEDPTARGALLETPGDAVA